MHSHASPAAKERSFYDGARRRPLLEVPWIAKFVSSPPPPLKDLCNSAYSRTTAEKEITYTAPPVSWPVASFRWPSFTGSGFPRCGHARTMYYQI